MSATRKPYLAQAGRSDLAELAPYAKVKRVIITGPGAAGKSALAVRLGEITSLPVIELDKLFWRPGLTATPRDQWTAIQRELAAHESWIMDGDLGPYDVLDVRLQAADTIVFLDFSPARCAWRAVRRSRERADFWWWLLTYRRRSRPLLLQAIAAHAGDAEIHVLRTPRAVSRFVARIASGTADLP
jgi:nicotinamide riboside kinase